MESEITLSSKRLFHPAIEENATGFHLPLDGDGSFLFLNSHQTRIRLFCKTAEGKNRGRRFEFEDIDVEI
ncbi:MAG: hypothetical protein WCI18_16725 [Pseudomonadota bacterium]